MHYFGIKVLVIAVQFSSSKVTSTVAIQSNHKQKSLNRL